MTQQQTNIGAAPNDGTGDTLRDAFITVNANATDAENRLVAVEPTFGYHNATLTPETSGTITVNTSLDSLRYVKTGNMVHVQGDVHVSSVSSPVGTYVEISLPFQIADLQELAGRVGGAVFYKGGSTFTTLPLLGEELSTSLFAYVDCSTIVPSDFFSFSITYEAS